MIQAWTLSDVFVSCFNMSVLIIIIITVALFLLSYFLLVYFLFLFSSATPSLRSLTCSGKDGMLLPALQRRFSIGFLPLSYLCIEPRQERIP